MGSLIDNKVKIMTEELKIALKDAESIDIMTAFFYFSGFNELAEDLKDKKIRILIGKTIDPKLISKLYATIKKRPTIDMSYFCGDFPMLNSSKTKDFYMKSFIEIFTMTLCLKNIRSEKKATLNILTQDSFI